MFAFLFLCIKVFLLAAFGIRISPQKQPKKIKRQIPRYDHRGGESRQCFKAIYTSKSSIGDCAASKLFFHESGDAE